MTITNNTVSAVFAPKEIDTEIGAEYVRLTTELETVKKQLLSASMDTEVFTMFNKIAGGGSAWGSRAPTVTIDPLTHTVVFEAKSSSAPYPYTVAQRVGEKTMNVLLTGKLLDEGQKKALVRELVPEVFHGDDGLHPLPVAPSDGNVYTVANADGAAELEFTFQNGAWIKTFSA